MSEERARIIDKAKKLKELADRGVDGEKETAQRMYDAYKKKHNLTDDDVKGHEYTEDFINEIKNMTDEELLEVIGKGLILLGVGLLYSLFSSFGDKKSQAKRNSDNAKRANEMNKMFSQMNKNKNKNKNNKNKKEETDDDIPSEDKKGIQSEIDNILDNEKKQNKKSK